MNLLTDPWLPFTLEDGSQHTLPLTAIARSDVVDFALPRADFQGAAYQFAIGLLQTVFAPEDRYQWLALFQTPPSSSQLAQAFARAAHAFNGTGDGPLFMQDYDPLTDQKASTISALLIDAPGENGIKNNTDHFVKRGIGHSLSLEMALLALYTLQINAPSGGAGHRVGLRGGGPLTTLVLPANRRASLWQRLWLNVINRAFLPYDDPDLSSERVFPWLAPTRTSASKGSEVYAADVHPLQMYWAMPRRIRLSESDSEGECALVGTHSTQLISSLRTQNYGVNYAGNWQHPLTPYKWNAKKPDADHLSLKGQPGGITYKIWHTLTLTDDSRGQQCATVVSHFYDICDLLDSELGLVPRLWAFGYDMDNMKARGWYASALPLFAIPPEQQADLLAAVMPLQALAEQALWHCRSAIKSAWFERPADAKGDVSFIDLAYWQRTEAAFFIAVSQLVDSAGGGDPCLAPAQAKHFLTALSQTALALFDEYALSELGSTRAMAKRIKARRQLYGWLRGGKDIKRFKEDNQMDQLKETA